MLEYKGISETAPPALDLLETASLHEKLPKQSSIMKFGFTRTVDLKGQIYYFNVELLKRCFTRLKLIGGVGENHPILPIGYTNIPVRSIFLPVFFSDHEDLRRLLFFFIGGWPCPSPPQRQTSRPSHRTPLPWPWACPAVAGGCPPHSLAGGGRRHGKAFF